jgi:phosphoribosylpyrophosphate synthetase
VQTGGKDVNNNIMELLIMAYACKTSAAKNIIGVIPYLPYVKQSKMRKRGAIVSKLLAKMMCKAGFTHIITMDMHHREVLILILKGILIKFFHHLIRSKTFQKHKLFFSFYL